MLMQITIQLLGFESAVIEKDALKEKSNTKRWKRSKKVKSSTITYIPVVKFYFEIRWICTLKDLANENFFFL